MRMNGIPIILTLAALALTSVHCGDVPTSQKLQIDTTATSYELTVPVSRLKMKIPKDALLPVAEKDIGGSTANPRYFRFEDRAKGLTISGWFEAAEGFASVKQAWNTDIEAWKKSKLPPPQNVSFIKLGGWDAVRYDNTIPGGNDCHLRAHWVQTGTWIDIHLSIFGKAKPDELHQTLENLLVSIQVSEKPA